MTYTYLVVLSNLKLNFIDRDDTEVKTRERSQQLAPGSSQRKARLTPQLQRTIIDRYASGLTSREVAEELGVGKSTVLTFLKRQGVTIRPVGLRYWSTTLK